ncbi:GDSL esterase/lipase At5g55050 [Linum grandiflorum]
METIRVSLIATGNFALCVLWTAVMKPPLRCWSQPDFSGPCAFFFGGASFDVGTNNYLNMSTGRADFPHNGIDFPAGATGRLSNGRNMADYIALKMGRNFSPPAYLSFVAGNSGTISESDLQSVLNNGGLNFASIGGGISDYGRRVYGQVVPVETQVAQMAGVARDLQTVFNATAAAAYLSRCVYYITITGNLADQLDYNLMFTDPSFLATVTSVHVSIIQFGIIAPTQIGCSPGGRSRSPTGRCEARANSIVAEVPSRLAIAMSMLRATNQDIKYSIGNTYNINAEITNSPTLYGIRNVTAACCGNGTTLCFPNSTLCGDREGYLYWSTFQPTQAAMKIGRNFSPPTYLSFVAGTSGTNISDLQSVLNNGGLNFASQGGGISDLARRTYSQVVPIGTQVSQLEGVARDLQTVFNSTAAAAYLTRCVYYMTIGSASIVNQLDNLIFSDRSFIERAASEYVSYIQALYAIGARKFGVVGPQQIGCSPFARATSPTGACNARANSIAAAIPSRLVLALSMFQDMNPDIIYSVANTYNINADISNSPTLYGIRNVTAACCGNGATLCAPNSTVCGDRDGHLYWGPFYLTQAGSRLAIEAFFSNNRRYTDPISFTELTDAPNPTE